jgi:hypothetical protein
MRCAVYHTLNMTNGWLASAPMHALNGSSCDPVPSQCSSLSNDSTVPLLHHHRSKYYRRHTILFQC